MVSVKVRVGSELIPTYPYPAEQCYDTVKGVCAFFRKLAAKQHYGPITILAALMTVSTCNSDFGSFISLASKMNFHRMLYLIISNQQP